MNDMTFIIKLAKPIQVFDWISSDGHTKITFDISKMLEHIASGKLKHLAVTTELDKDFACRWLPQRDLNMKHIGAFTRVQMNAPVLAVIMADDEALLIDGSHRYFARFIKNLPTVDCNLIEFADWQDYAIISVTKEPGQ